MGRLRHPLETPASTLLILDKPDAGARPGSAMNSLRSAWTDIVATDRRGTAVRGAWCALHRKSSLFYRTRKGAQMGDLFMSVIHTCELNDINAFDYLTELLRHTQELKRNPSEWMPWNYRGTLARLATPTAAYIIRSCVAEKDHLRPDGIVLPNAHKRPPSKENPLTFLARMQADEMFENVSCCLWALFDESPTHFGDPEPGHAKVSGTAPRQKPLTEVRYASRIAPDNNISGRRRNR